MPNIIINMVNTYIGGTVYARYICTMNQQINNYRANILPIKNE